MKTATDLISALPAEFFSSSRKHNALHVRLARVLRLLRNAAEGKPVWVSATSDGGVTTRHLLPDGGWVHPDILGGRSVGNGQPQNLVRALRDLGHTIEENDEGCYRLVTESGSES